MTVVLALLCLLSFLIMRGTSLFLFAGCREGRPVSQCELRSARNVLPKVVITRKILLLSFLFFFFLFIRTGSLVNLDGS